MPTTLTAYTFDELTPEAKERALKGLPDAECDYTLEECMDSLKALCKLAGVKLADWSLGPYSRSYVKVQFVGEKVFGYEIGDISGPRSLAWIENNIMGPLRRKWTPATVPPSEKWAGIHGKYSRRYTKPGEVPSCPFTGVCFDEDLLDAFRGRDLSLTLRERFESLAGIIQRICESELEYQDGEGRMERAECHFDGALFDETGNKLKS